MSIMISKETKDLIVSTYVQYPRSLSEMASMFSYCRETISDIIHEYNVPIWTKNQIINRDANEDYFSYIRTEEQAYLLGFFIADGCIYKSQIPTQAPLIIFEISNNDLYMVERWHNAIKSPNKIRTDSSNCSTSTISSWKMAYDLECLGAGRGKPYRQLPTLPLNLIPHLVRGLFDGDGSFGYRVANPQRGENSAKRGCVDIVAYPKVMMDLEWIYYNLIGVEKIGYNRRYEYTNLISMRLERKADIMRFYNFVYSNATIYLTRKKKKFEEFFSLMNMNPYVNTEIT